jgi:exopolyphosphatase/guanosine-5'-triphosphate,3'-diphosphate pyrophosphatase
MIGTKNASERTRRIGAIDVGTNSIRLIVAEAGADGNYRVLDDEKVTARLGQGLQATGRMAPEAMARAAQAIERMKSIADGFSVEMLRVIGTCAVREAANRDELLDLVRQHAGLLVEPIEAEEEAHLAHLSVGHAFDLRHQAVAVVDIGGGSTEIILSSGGVVEQVYSLPLGAVRLSEECGASDESTDEGFRRLRRTIRRRLRQGLNKLPFVPQMVIGTGGTFTSLANISLRRAKGRFAEHASTRGDHAAANGSSSPTSIRGYEMKRPEVRHLVDWLRTMPLRERARIPGLSPDRADIIVAGAAIVERILKYLGVNRLQVHDGGVRDGLLRSMVTTVFPGAGGAVLEPPDPLRSVRQFAASCSYEQAHCHHVAALAGMILDQLPGATEPAGPGAASERRLLEAAALLKDVGYLVNYSKHHHHSYHLIVHSDLTGFSPREVHLVANVARYHRKARPRRKHANFASLCKPDRALVRRLAAILRIADGLDRNRLQNIRNVSVRFEPGITHFLLEADANPTVEIWGAESKSELFEEVFGVETRFQWVHA